ncbi:MAG: hypothetical protein J7L15_02580 [Clostridiales bacterium]|nr:hypothetical protein [Clostridiales bacterium]
MRIQVKDGRIIDVRFHKSPRTDKRGHKLIDTACVISEMVGCAAGKVAFEPLFEAKALHCYKDQYNKYLGKRVSLNKALHISDFSTDESDLLVTAFEEEFKICKKNSKR